MPMLCRLHRSGSRVSPRASSVISGILPGNRIRIVADGGGPVSRTFPAAAQDVPQDREDPRGVGGVARDRPPVPAPPVVLRPGVTERAQEGDADGALRPQGAPE